MSKTLKSSHVSRRNILINGLAMGAAVCALAMAAVANSKGSTSKGSTSPTVSKNPPSGTGSNPNKKSVPGRHKWSPIILKGGNAN